MGGNDFYHRLLAESFFDAAKHMGLKKEMTFFTSWLHSTQETSSKLSEPSKILVVTDLSALSLSGVLWPDNIPNAAKAVVESTEQQPLLKTQEQEAWEILTKAEDRVRDLEAREKDYDIANRVHEFICGLPAHFEQARDETLLNLYTSIETRFTELYRAIHREDESTFEGSLKPSGAALTLEVDFYGRGSHPPHALHSEGHQDTMGLCLYLALSERLIGSTIGMTIFDDAVMSVDADHRRHVCEMLKEFFNDRQFIITTHERLWSRQLQTTSMAKKKNVIRFSGWSVDTGPVLEVEKDFWSTIERDLGNGDVPAAAHRLRRNAEAFFEGICEQLQGKVIFRADGRYSLGDYAPAAVSAYRKLLKRATQAARSWERNTELEHLRELDSVASQVIALSQVEQPAINEAVHFNRWSEMRKPDFEPVASAWADLMTLFQCSSCNGTIYIKGDSVRCACQGINWNLEAKGSSS